MLIDTELAAFIEQARRDHPAPRDPGDNLGPGQVEQIVIALLIVVERKLAAIVGFDQALGLDLGAVGAVLDENAARGLGADSGGNTQALTPSK